MSKKAELKQSSSNALSSIGEFTHNGEYLQKNLSKKTYPKNLSKKPIQKKPIRDLIQKPIRKKKEKT
jgi:hypothetical protein